MSIVDVIQSIERDAFDRCINNDDCSRLTEHRCSCGRLLGRFNGQAEVKCPKCGKMNVIGVMINEEDTNIVRESI